MTGGGSGGHITPLLAVAEKIKKERPDTKVFAVSERFGKFNSLLDAAKPIDQTYSIFAGKLRRYHNEPWLSRVLDIKTLLLNIKDLFLLLIGLFDAVFVLLRIRPDVIFIKGGYVGVPIGLASRLLRIPYITHDSDASAGLTNRIIAPGAIKNAVGMPAAMYSYEKTKTVYTGVPIREEYLNFTKKDYQSKRKDLKVADDELLLVVIGGSNGAQRIDKIMHEILKHLMVENPELRVIQQVGENNEHIYEDYPESLKARIHTDRFLSPLIDFLGASDLVVSRAGATVIAELAALERPSVIIPHPELTGGHQLENAKLLQQKGAAIVVDEQSALKDANMMKKGLADLIKSQKLRKKLAQNLHKSTPLDASSKICDLLLSTGVRN